MLPRLLPTLPSKCVGQWERASAAIISPVYIECLLADDLNAVQYCSQKTGRYVIGVTVSGIFAYDARDASSDELPACHNRQLSPFATSAAQRRMRMANWGPIQLFWKRGGKGCRPNCGLGGTVVVVSVLLRK